MTQQEIIKKVLEYNKKGFEQAYASVEELQVRAEQITGEALEQAELIPEQGKIATRQLLEAGQKIREGFKEAVLKGHERLETILVPG